MENFEDVIPHDAVILDVMIDRTNPEIDGEIRIRMIFEDDSRKTLGFTGMYYATFELNFGIIALESVYSVWLEPENRKIAEIVETWKIMGCDLNGLQCFVINTNSTNSTLKIFAKDFYLHD